MSITYLLEKRIPLSLQELVKEKLDQANLDFKMVYYTDPKEKIMSAFDQSIAVLCAPGRFIEPNLYINNNKIKLFQLWSSGFDKFDITTPASKNIYVCNNGGANALCVAEHTILLILAQYKNIVDSHRRTVNGNWEGNSHGMDMFMLKNKIIGIVGLGNIGTEVARRLHAFGCKFLVYDTEIKKPDSYSFDFQQTSLEYLASHSDVISLHLHHNEKTDKIINQKIFGLMKPSAVLINVSRAGLVDQDEFLTALSSRKIAGAGLDVYPSEPTKSDNPILLHPRVVATPHIAGSTIDVYHTALNACVSNIQKVLDNTVPNFIVNGI